MEERPAELVLHLELGPRSVSPTFAEHRISLILLLLTAFNDLSVKSIIKDGQEISAEFRSYMPRRREIADMSAETDRRLNSLEQRHSRD